MRLVVETVRAHRGYNGGVRGAYGGTGTQGYPCCCEILDVISPELLMMPPVRGIEIAFDSVRGTVPSSTAPP